MRHRKEHQREWHKAHHLAKKPIGSFVGGTLKTCIVCNATFQARTSAHLRCKKCGRPSTPKHRKYTSGTYRNGERGAWLLHRRSCIDCGKLFATRRSVRCDDCRRERINAPRRHLRTICLQCGKAMPPTDGRRKFCVDCSEKRSREQKYRGYRKWAAKNRERLRAYEKEYYIQNLERCRENGRRSTAISRAKNPELHRAKWRRWYWKDPA